MSDMQTASGRPRNASLRRLLLLLFHNEDGIA